MSKPSQALYALLLLIGAPAIANAHISGLDHGFVSGLIHPLTGADHLATLLAAGFLARRMGGPARTLIPASFVLALIIGAALAATGAEWRLIEPALWGSALLMIGLCIRGYSLTLAPSCALTVIVGIPHGYAHVSETSLPGGLEQLLAGLLIASTALIGVGMALGSVGGFRERSTST